MLRKLILLAPLALGLASVCSAADTTVTPLTRVDDQRPGGYSMLVRKESSILARVDTGSPLKGEQVWWLVFNNPEACSTRPCSLRDIYRKDTRADLIPADEEQRARSAAGNMCLTAGAASESLMPRFGMPANGLIDANTAEVQLLVAEAARQVEAWVRRMSSDSLSDCAGGSCGKVMIAVHTPRG